MKRIDKVTLQFEIEEQRKGDALNEINEDLRKQIELVDDLEKQKREAEKNNGTDNSNGGQLISADRHCYCRDDWTRTSDLTPPRRVR